MKTFESTDKLRKSAYINSSSKIDTGLSNINMKRMNSEKNFNKKNLNEFNINSEPSEKGEKEKALKNIISNINLDESREKA